VRALVGGEVNVVRQMLSTFVVDSIVRKQGATPDYCKCESFAFVRVPSGMRRMRVIRAPSHASSKQLFRVVTQVVR
jgi:hypothetical protein